MKKVTVILQVIITITVPLFLLTTNIHWAVNSQRLYSYGFTKYEIARTTGISELELQKVAGALIDYFNFRRDTLQITVSQNGKGPSLFKERELVHLEDVRNLVKLNDNVQMAAVILLALASLALLLWNKAREWLKLVRGFRAGSVLAGALVVGLGLISLFAYDQFFLFFHLASFTNDYWILDPAQHYLIQMFPQGFFYDATIFVAAATMIEALICGGTALTLVRLVETKSRKIDSY